MRIVRWFVSCYTRWILHSNLHGKFYVNENEPKARRETDKPQIAVSRAETRGFLLHNLTLGSQTFYFSFHLSLNKFSRPINILCIQNNRFLSKLFFTSTVGKEKNFGFYFIAQAFCVYLFFNAKLFG